MRAAASSLYNARPDARAHSVSVAAQCLVLQPAGKRLLLHKLSVHIGIALL